MKNGINGWIIAACLVLLVGCGGKDEADESVSEAPEAATAPVVAEKAFNPLAEQQQAMKYAQKVQGLLDDDAEKKKAALADLEDE